MREIHYWDELIKIMEWSKTHVTSTLHICWGAQARLCIIIMESPNTRRKRNFPGVYRHKVLDRKGAPCEEPGRLFLLSLIPDIRRSGEEDIRKHDELVILAKSEEAGVFLVMSRDGKQIFMQGHPEYDRMTLNNEYHRDLKRA